MPKPKTMTLGHQDNPSVVLLAGHVKQGKFNQAFRREWGRSVGASYKQSELRYEYWHKTKRGLKKGIPGERNAKPYTVVNSRHDNVVTKVERVQ